MNKSILTNLIEHYNKNKCFKKPRAEQDYRFHHFKVLEIYCITFHNMPQ